jgi:addiction module HigA family antidote
VIQSFANETSLDLFRERNTRAARRIPRELWRGVQRKLKLLDAAGRLDDLAVPAGNRLEPLKGDQAGRHSIRVNERYRVTFRWENGMRTKYASKTVTRDPEWLGPAIPPGEILLEEYLKPLGLGQLEASKRLGISLNRLNEIVLGKRGITADTALRLGRLLKTSPQLWMRLQADWDLHEAMRRQARRAS